MFYSKNNKLGKNAFLNGIKQGCSIMFPLVSFMYCSRILGAAQLGIYSFGQSIISYFLLISCLGIPTYAVREGAACRNNLLAIRKFINEVFSINCITTIIAYISLFFCIVLIEDVNKYKYIIIIQSLQIILTTLGADWINSIFEDYIYLTIRYIIFQLLSLIALFIFVKDKNSLYIYTFISVLANVGGNIFNFVYIRKNSIKIQFTLNVNLRKHLRPILTLFFNNVASIIYLNSDVTMLGILTDNIQVGIYTISSRIYTTVKSLINAIIMVTVPRFSRYVAEEKMEDLKIELKKVFEILVILIFPIVVGMFMEADKIIFVIAGEGYLEGSNVVRILSISILFAVFACFFSYSILLPNKKEIYFMNATITAAVLNVVLNIFLIPRFGIEGAATTTLIAEIIVFLISFISSKKIIIFLISKRNIVEVIISCIIEFMICKLIDLKIHNIYLALFLDIVFGGGMYFFILIFFKKYFCIKRKSN